MAARSTAPLPDAKPAWAGDVAGAPVQEVAADAPIRLHGAAALAACHHDASTQLAFRWSVGDAAAQPRWGRESAFSQAIVLYGARNVFGEALEWEAVGASDGLRLHRSSTNET